MSEAYGAFEKVPRIEEIIKKKTFIFNETSNFIDIIMYVLYAAYNE